MVTVLMGNNGNILTCRRKTGLNPGEGSFDRKTYQ
jgi:hypothetical protein